MEKVYTVQYNAMSEKGNWFYFADNEEIKQDWIIKDLLAGDWNFDPQSGYTQANADDDGALYAEIVVFLDGEEIGRKAGYIKEIED